MQDPTPAAAIPDRRLPPPLRLLTLIPLRHNLAVFFAVVFAGIFEGIGVVTLLPLISVLGDEGSKANALSQLVLGALDRFGLPRDPLVLLGLIAGGMVLKAGLVLLALREVGRGVADVSARMRLNLVEVLLHARWSYYVRQPVGRFSTALGAEATRAGETYNAMTQMFMQLMQALVYLSIAAIASWQLAVACLLVSLVMIGSLNRFLVISKRNAKKQTQRLNSMLSRLTDVLIGIKPMKAMARQARFNRLFMEDLKEIKKAARRQVFSRNANRALQEPILTLCLTLGIFMALRVLNLPIGEVLVMSLLLAKVVSVVGKAQQELQNIYANQSGLASVLDTISETRANHEFSEGAAVPRFRHDLSFQNVSFGFGGKSIVIDASFTLKSGEIVALTGPSGAGKTTVVDLLLGLHSPTAGQILIDGEPLTGLDVVRWRQLTGYVPQELMLFHDSVLANITLGQPEFSREDVERALRQAGAWDFVSQLSGGMDSIVGERGTLLSGGQRQRIAIARALVHKPRLLILDEATSALDPSSESTIVDNVVSLAKSTGLTVLSISHHSAWMDCADRVLSLDAGHLVEISA